DGDFKKLGRGLSLHAVHAHAVGPCVFEVDAGEVSDAVGRDIGVWVAHLVDELLLDRGNVDATARALVLRDDERAVGSRLDDGKADARQVWNVLPVVLAVAARDLRAALDNVAGNRARGEAVPVRLAPAELVNHRPEREARVGRAPGDDDARAAVQSLDDGPRAEVCVRAPD